MKHQITTCCIAVEVLLITSVLEADNIKPNQNDSVRTGRSLSDFMTPDGRLDLNAIRGSGYQGPIDLKGVDLRVDPRSGAPTIIASPQSPADDPDDQYWDSSMSLSIQGVNGNVWATAVWNGRLIVGGDFTVAGGVAANGVAAWDGSNWYPLGLGIIGSVWALTGYDGKLIAGGNFDSAGGIPANNISSWDGSSWSPLGLGMEQEFDPSVYSLVEYDGKLIAAGKFSAAGGVATCNIASWDGSNWQPLESGLTTQGTIYALAVYDDRLIAGGERTFLDSSDSVHTIASWDGSSWSVFGVSLNGFAVYALTIYDGKLIAGGRAFRIDGSTSASDVASWDGVGWLSLKENISGRSEHSFVSALTVHDNKLIAGSNYLDHFWCGGSVISWDGNSWSFLDKEFEMEDNGVTTLTIYGGKLVAGGPFKRYSGGIANGVLSWDGTTWSPLQSGGGSVYALTVYDGKLIAGGDFTAAGGVPANHIASWDGSNWSPLGSGITGGENIPWVSALTVYDGKLIAAGGFDSASGVVANNIASWDGSSWLPLGSGMDGGVSALTVYDGKLIAGGGFATAGGESIANIASWDGTKWSALGPGRQSAAVALTVFDNKLVAGTNSVNLIERIASWDGSNWVDLNTSYLSSYRVQVLAVHDNKLLVGRSKVSCFTDCNGLAGVEAWDGANWTAILLLGAGGDWGVLSSLNALTTYEDKLIIGGTLDYVWEWNEEGVQVDNIASWDGDSFTPLGSGVARTGYLPPPYGLPAQIFALTAYDGKLIVGGNFTDAGGKVSLGLAAWTKHDPTDVGEQDRTNLPKACSLVQNYPNPFNPTTTIEYNVPTRTHVTVEIFNLLGQHVRTLVDELKSAGSYKAEWNGTDATGKSVSTGVYLYRLKAGDFVETKKMLLLK